MSEFALSQPHAAFSAYIHGEQHRFTYFLRTIPGMEKYLDPLNKIIDEKLIPNIFGSSFSEDERRLFSLPIRDGGMGIRMLDQSVKLDFELSQMITKPLVNLIIQQSDFIPSKNEESIAKKKASDKKNEIEKKNHDDINSKFEGKLKRAIEEASEKGASTWLSARPSEEHGFALNKSEFRDSLAFRYNRPLKNLPSQCPCGQKYDVTHALNCKRGGFIIIRHNNVRDFEASLLRKICNDVETEPVLTAIQNETLSTGTLRCENARADIRSRGFWRKGQNAFFDVKITNADADSQARQPLNTLLKKHEREKKRLYNDRIMNIEGGSFTPLIFTIKGVMGPECAVYHKHLADRIAEKTGEHYNKVITYIRTKLSFIVLRSALLCIRGSRTSSKVTPNVGEDFGLYATELRI